MVLHSDICNIVILSSQILEQPGTDLSVMVLKLLQSNFRCRKRLKQLHNRFSDGFGFSTL